jgi:hypothetical protein
MKTNDLGVRAAGTRLAIETCRKRQDGAAEDTMRDDEITKVERPQNQPSPSDIDDALTWLSEHVGFPARSRQDLEQRRRERDA